MLVLLVISITSSLSNFDILYDIHIRTLSTTYFYVNNKYIYIKELVNFIKKLNDF